MLMALLQQDEGKNLRDHLHVGGTGRRCVRREGRQAISNALRQPGSIRMLEDEIGRRGRIGSNKRMLVKHDLFVPFGIQKGRLLP